MERIFGRIATLALLLALLLFSCSDITDISGAWRGESTDTLFDRHSTITLIISQDGNKISGRYEHSFWGSGSIVNGSFDGTEIMFIAKDDDSEGFNDVVIAKYTGGVIIGKWGGFEDFTLGRYK